MTSSNGTVLTHKSNDAYIEKNKKEDERKERAAKETSYRLALYKKVRQRGFSGFSLASLRAFVKQMLTDDNGYELDEDVFTELKGIYPFMSNYTYDSASEFIDNAPLDVVQLVLVDLVLSESLIVNSWNINDVGNKTDRFLTVSAIARAEGIDPDQVRAELEKPAEPEPAPEPVKEVSKRKQPARQKAKVTGEAQAASPAQEAEEVKQPARRGRKPKPKPEPESSDTQPPADDRLAHWPYPTGAK